MKFTEASASFASM